MNKQTNKQTKRHQKTANSGEGREFDFCNDPKNVQFSMKNYKVYKETEKIWPIQGKRKNQQSSRQDNGNY